MHISKTPRFGANGTALRADAFFQQSTKWRSGFTFCFVKAAEPGISVTKRARFASENAREQHCKMLKRIGAAFVLYLNTGK
jgi:hypothetical protein